MKIMARIDEPSTASTFNIKEYAWIEDYQGFEAKEIAELYYKTYNIRQQDLLKQVSYPYQETLDPKWIHKTVLSEDVIWKVVTDTLNDKIIGSGTVLLNRSMPQSAENLLLYISRSKVNIATEFRAGHPFFSAGLTDRTMDALVDNWEC
jgi:S-adenosylmethionine synthetase